ARRGAGYLALATALQTPIDLFRCPSDPAPALNEVFYPRTNGISFESRGINSPLATRFELPVSSYAAAHCSQESRNFVSANMNGTQPTNGTGCDFEDHDGMFGVWSYLSFRDVTDGLSNTVMIGERAYQRRLANETDESRRFARAGLLYMAALCNDGRRMSAALVNGKWGINVNDVQNNAQESLGSTHAGGAQVVLGDGSVRFLSENINSDPTNGGGTVPTNNPPNSTNRNSILEYLFCRDDGTVLGEF
ncbi:MAG: DUF1559 domain-containing protein, partial [Planctomycetota bacterium]